MEPSSGGQNWSAVIGIIIIIAVLVFGGAYVLLTQRASSSPADDIPAAHA